MPTSIYLNVSRYLRQIEGDRWCGMGCVALYAAVLGLDYHSLNNGQYLRVQSVDASRCDPWHRVLCRDGPVRLLHSYGPARNHTYLSLFSAILLPAFKHDEWKPFVAKPHQTWIGASHYVGPSMQQPVFYATPAPQQLIYAVHPHQQQYAPGAMMMQVPVQGGYIQGHFVPTTAVQPQPVPTAQPAFASPGSSGADLASKNNLLASGTPGPGSDPNMS